MQNPNSVYIRTLFDRLAARYDLFNHLTSMGLATRWRKKALETVRPGMRVLDLGCGTGDLALGAAKKMRGEGEVTGLDFSEAMLAEAEKRRLRMGVDRRIFRTALKKAEELPIDTKPYDLVLSGFVLRNLYENIDKILKGVYASLKPGGQIRFLDFTEPDKKAVRLVWRWYMRTLVVLYGKLLFGKHFPADYMTDSAERFLKAPAFVRKLEDTGFKNVEARPFLFGIIRLYQGVKPAESYA